MLLDMSDKIWSLLSQICKQSKEEATPSFIYSGERYLQLHLPLLHKNYHELFHVSCFCFPKKTFTSRIIQKIEMI
jgi:hypothetical protein